MITYIVVRKMTFNKELIGIRIMQRRKACGLTQEQLAEKIGLSKNHLSSIERGIYTPTVPLLFNLCEALGETPDYYLIGKLSAEGKRIVELVESMPAEAQRITCCLIEAYLKSL